jgi:hypothetical protein
MHAGGVEADDVTGDDVVAGVARRRGVTCPRVADTNRRAEPTGAALVLGGVQVQRTTRRR